MEITLTQKAKMIITSQIARGDFVTVDEAVNSLILSTQEVIEHRLDELEPIIAERINQPDSNDITVDDGYFEKFS